MVLRSPWGIVIEKSISRQLRSKGQTATTCLALRGQWRPALLRRARAGSYLLSSLLRPAFVSQIGSQVRRGSQVWLPEIVMLCYATWLSWTPTVLDKDSHCSERTGPYHGIRICQHRHYKTGSRGKE
jgi:hypothetical protein